MENLISIVICSYNGEHFIDRCLNSIYTQDYSQCEIIFIDDGSTDNTKIKIDEWQKKLPILKYYYQDNKWITEARNNGIQQSKGLYFLFLDVDDCLDNDAIKEMKNGINIFSTADIIVMDYAYVDKYHHQTQCSYQQYANKANSIDNKNWMEIAASGWCWGKLFNTKKIKTNHLYIEGKAFEDVIFFLKIYYYSLYIAYYNKHIYLYYHTPFSLTTSVLNTKKIKNRINDIEILYRIANDNQGLQDKYFIKFYLEKVFKTLEIIMGMRMNKTYRKETFFVVMPFIANEIKKMHATAMCKNFIDMMQKAKNKLVVITILFYLCLYILFKINKHLANFCFIVVSKLYCGFQWFKARVLKKATYS